MTVEQSIALSGMERRRTPPWALELLQIVSGYLLVRWLVWLAGRYLLGFEVRGTLALAGGRIEYRSLAFLLGREIRKTEETFLARDVVSVGLETRFPHLLLLAGAFGLLLGAIWGLTAVIDGIQAHYVAISVVGLGALALGVLLDIGLGALFGHLGPRTALVFTLRSQTLWGPGRRFRLLGVDEDAARAFAARLAQPAQTADSTTTP